MRLHNRSALVLTVLFTSLLGGSAVAEDAQRHTVVSTQRDAPLVALDADADEDRAALEDLVWEAYESDVEDGSIRPIRLKTNSNDPVEYECGATTCTCHHTLDCLIMSWDKTDGPCSSTGSGTTCCINESCS